MKRLFQILLCCLPVLSFAQGDSVIHQNVIQSEKEDLANWIDNLYEIGLEMTEDSVKVSKEFQTVLRDENYRTLLYPESYSWPAALELMQGGYLKQAFWYFINLYPENDTNKELVVKSILAYDQLLKMDEVLIATFYTYSFIDPEISTIQDGIPEITRPDILEAKLRNVKEIVSYIQQYRIQNENKLEEKEK